MKCLFSLLALLYSVTAWGNDGDTFVAKSNEGIEMTFTIISEAEKTCRVGTDDIYNEYIDHNQPSIDRDQRGELTIPASVNGYTVEAIGAYAFCECKIEGVKLPNSIKVINKYAFAFNDYLKAIDIPENVETIEEGALGWCDNLTQVKLHDGLKTIDMDAFYASGLTSIVLPKTLEYIGYEAFRANPLATITVCSSSPTPINYYKSFNDDIYQRTTLYVPQGLQNKYRANSNWGSFRKIKEGKPSFECPADIAYPVDADEDDWQYIICNSESSLDVNFVNKRDNPVSSISYIPIIGGVEGEEQTYEFPEPIAADGKPFTMPASLPIINDPKSYKFLFEITKINGVEVDYGADIMTNACISGTAFVPVASHKVLLKNYTSPSCLWAPRSLLGLDKIKEKYGDDVICISYHVAGPLWCDPFSYTPITPSCELDGNSGWRENDDFNYYDPYYGKGSTPFGIFDLIEEKMASPHLGNIRILSAEWADDEQTEINIVTESTLGVGYEQNTYYPDYLLIFTLVEDGLKGNGSEWEQLNGYSQMATDDPNLQSLSKLPYTITDMVYNDVAVGEYRDHISRNFNYGESVQQTNTLHLSDLSQKLIQDKSKLSVVVRLQDKCGSWPWAEGRTQIDCAKLPISSSSLNVQTIKQNVLPHDVYDLSGRKIKSAATMLNNLPKGVYIYNGKKIVIGNK